MKYLKGTLKMLTEPAFENSVLLLLLSSTQCNYAFMNNIMKNSTVINFNRYLLSGNDKIRRLIIQMDRKLVKKSFGDHGSRAFCGHNIKFD